jgi:hypothetical protein
MDAGTIVRPALRLSVRKPGWWRTRWRSQQTLHFSNYSHPVGPGEWAGYGRWPSREIADQKAQDWLKTNADLADAAGIEYLGAEFLPENPD